MIKNPNNGLIAVGSDKGVVSFYTPNSSDAVLKILSHNAIVKSIDFT